MRERIICGAAVVLLGLPTALAFFAGGYFDAARLWGMLAAWVALAAIALVVPRPLPAGLGGRLALGGLALMTAVVGLSIGRAPLAGPALDDFQRLLMYVAVLAGAIAVLARPRIRAWVEPALALGTVIVVGYGLSGRLLPDLVPQAVSAAAGGRLNQPLTYWNAMGALAAFGLLLAIRLAGAPRPPWLRMAAAAACPWLGAGLALTVSRGGILAFVVGALALLAAAGRIEQARACALGVAAALASAAATLPLNAVRLLEGSDGGRRLQGLVALALLCGLSAAAALATRRLLLDGGHAGPLSRTAVRAVLGTLVAVAIAGAVIVAAGRGNHQAPSPGQFGATTKRLASVESSRSSYWRVGLRSFADHPLLGVGPAGFRVEWLRERPFDEPAKDAHSIYVETATELGLAGLLTLALLIAGACVSATRALRRSREMAAGAVAVAAAFAVHAGVDWDWEMPAVSLVALLAIGLLAGLAEPGAPGGAASGPTPPR